MLTDVPDSRFLTPLMSDEDENDETPTNPGGPLECETPTGESSPPKRESKLGRFWKEDKTLRIVIILKFQQLTGLAG